MLLRIKKSWIRTIGGGTFGTTFLSDLKISDLKMRYRTLPVSVKTSSLASVISLGQYYIHIMEPVISDTTYRLRIVHTFLIQGMQMNGNTTMAQSVRCLVRWQMRSSEMTMPIEKDIQESHPL
jgi:hypothetical protein